MPHAFVTGATGFLGTNLVEQLCQQGWNTTALHRAQSNVQALHKFGVTGVVGDLTDGDSVLRAMPENVDAVFHVAANTSTWQPHHAQQTRENVIGTRHVCAAALARNAKRLVHISSIAAYGLRDDVITEESAQLGGQAPINYYRTKAAAEQEVRLAVARGLHAVIVNPSHIVGPHDRHNWARIFRLIKAGKLPGIPPGQGSFCYAPEVAKTLIAAAEKGRVGANYLLGGTEASFLEVVQFVGKKLNKKVPNKTVPAWTLRTLGRFNDLMSRVTGKEPDITFESALIVCSHASIASTRARDELGFCSPPLEQMLTLSLALLQEENLL